MAARSPIFDNVDPRLVSLIEQLGGKFGKYGVRTTSGYRPKTGRKQGRYHPRGQALDVELFDPTTGKGLENYQDPANFKAYQELANALYKSADPELRDLLRWGGYFSGDPGKYGALDLMHFDLGGNEMGMKGGSWAGGLTPEQAKIWGLTTGGGIDPAMVASAKAAGYTDEQIKAAFLGAVSGTESPGYNVLYGGETFSDMSRHPNRRMPIFDKAGQVTNYSTAAGRYQFLNDTWEAQAKKLGLKDFSAQSQDAAAWDLADSEFKRLTGGSLMEALQSGDPARINAAAQTLNKQWTSLPGGAEQAKRYAGSGLTFADAYKQSLAGAGGSSVHPPQATVTTSGSSEGSDVVTDKTDANSGSKNWADRFADAFGGLGKNLFGEGDKRSLGASATLRGGGMVNTPGPTISGASADEARSNLAQALSKLNSRRLA